ncbi:MAG TPA: dihydropteroate synthase [Streptosporangiaceae bacterium]|nr:dihydropteroate synthase [Streptosporangiaceae bacterium]
MLKEPSFSGEPSVPRIIGVVNITEDSFSDGGRYLSPDDALTHARQLRDDGAAIVELGPAASHPDSKPVSPDEERKRLTPVMARLVAEGVSVSVDSFLPETQRFALAHGVTYLNDIQGFPYPDIYPLLAEADCRLIVMHSIQRRGPASMVVTDPTEVRAGVLRFFDERLAALQAAGIAAERLIIDPGLGFFLGSNPEPSLLILATIRQLKERYGLPVLVSPSRKSFVRTVTGRGIADAGAATLAAELYAAWQGVDYIRTHDVAALHTALTVIRAIAAARS